MRRGRGHGLYGRTHQCERVQLDNRNADRLPVAAARDRRYLRAQLRLEKPVHNGRARRQRRHDRAGQRRGLEQRDVVNRLSQGLIEIRHDAVDVVVPVRVHLRIDVQIWVAFAFRRDPQLRDVVGLPVRERHVERFVRQELRRYRQRHFPVFVRLDAVHADLDRTDAGLRPVSDGTPRAVAIQENPARILGYGIFNPGYGMLLNANNGQIKRNVIRIARRTI